MLISSLIGLNLSKCVSVITRNNLASSYSSHHSELWSWCIRGCTLTTRTLTGEPGGCLVGASSATDKGKCLPSHKQHGPGNHVSLNVIVESMTDLSSMPSCYHHLREVFSKAKAQSLPPHGPVNCPIDLIPSAVPFLMSSMCLTSFNKQTFSPNYITVMHIIS